MGKKKDTATLGRAVIKDRFKSRQRKPGNSFLHTTELEDGYDWNKINLKSVTEENTLDEFLTTAEMAGTEFTAEKMNFTIVNDKKSIGLLSEEEEKKLRETQDSHRQLLKIPRRPDWDVTITKEELDQSERDSFLDWRRSLAKLQEMDGIIMTPFERNLEFWRQLWRVIERSDIIVQIVDGRNPLLFRCEDLESYVKEVDSNKINMLLVNKADLLSEEQRQMWVTHFDNLNLRIAFWSAVNEIERIKLEAAELAGMPHSDEDANNSESDEDDSENDNDDDDDDDDDDGDDECEDDNEKEENDIDDVQDEEDKDNKVASKDNKVASKDKNAMEKKNASSKDSSAAANENNDDDDDDDDSAWSDVDSEDSDEDSREPVKQNDSVAVSPGQPTVSDKKDDAVSDESTQPDVTSIDRPAQKLTSVQNSSKVLSGLELIDLFRSLHEPKHDEKDEEPLVVGLVGYPNVGKSSTVNALLKTKKVPVSATPGRTKHFQTLHLDPQLILCDCPGLVMPTFVSTKADMITNGILPIDQMRDYVAPVSLVCKYVDRDILETVYGIMLPLPGEAEDPDRYPTAIELLTSHASIRGFMTHKGVPDFQRSARHILKDYVNGKLLYCYPPPGITCDVFKSASHRTTKQKKQRTLDSNMATGEEKRSTTSTIDDKFFTKSQSAVGSRGVVGVMNFTRKDGYSNHHSSGSVQSSEDLKASTSSVAEKPWKRHNNVKRKEKLRRVYGHLDA